jgi:hypothetical protein
VSNAGLTQRPPDVNQRIPILNQSIQIQIQTRHFYCAAYTCSDQRRHDAPLNSVNARGEGTMERAFTVRSRLQKSAYNGG